MKYYKVEVSTSYVGEDDTYIVEVPDNVEEDALEERFKELARDNADSYGRIQYDEDDNEFDDEEDDAYSFEYEELKMSKDEVLDNFGKIDESW